MPGEKGHAQLRGATYFERTPQAGISEALEEAPV